MIYLTIAYKVNDIMDEETTREVIRKTVEDFKRIDLAKYKVRSSNEVQKLQGSFVISFIFAYL